MEHLAVVGRKNDKTGKFTERLYVGRSPCPCPISPGSGGRDLLCERRGARRLEPPVWVRAGCASGIAASAAPDRAHELGAAGTRIADTFQSQPPRKPARRSPTFTYGQRRMISQIKPVR